MIPSFIDNRLMELCERVLLNEQTFLCFRSLPFGLWRSLCDADQHNLLHSEEALLNLLSVDPHDIKVCCLPRPGYDGFMTIVAYLDKFCWSGTYHINICHSNGAVIINDNKVVSGGVETLPDPGLDEKIEGIRFRELLEIVAEETLYRGDLLGSALTPSELPCSSWQILGEIASSLHPDTVRLLCEWGISENDIVFSWLDHPSRGSDFFIVIFHYIGAMWTYVATAMRGLNNKNNSNNK